MQFAWITLLSSVGCSHTPETYADGCPANGVAPPSDGVGPSVPAPIHDGASHGAVPDSGDRIHPSALAELRAGRCLAPVGCWQQPEPLSPRSPVQEPQSQL